jgi:hypothetical protein
MQADSWVLTWTTYGTWLPGAESGFVGNVIEEAANDAIQSANVGRAADASRRVSFNERILINDNNILPLLDLTRRLASAARIRPMPIANYSTPNQIELGYVS